MRIQMICPAPPGSAQGNRITALRWARILRSLGGRVRIQREFAGEADLLLALHARKSAASVSAFRRRHPERPVLVALTGTDLYGDLGRSGSAARSLALADRLVLLQAAGLRRLDPRIRRKARVIHQSAVPARRSRRAAVRRFDALVLAHVRPVKDPLRAALAVRDVPRASRLRVLHLGAALDPKLTARARAEEARNPRYRWLGERTHAGARRLLARSHLLVLSSRMEGGANAIAEAAVAGVPILASRVEGNVGLLGARHPGLFPLGDTAALRALLLRAEECAEFYTRLRRASRALAPIFRPARERAAWARLLREVGF